MQAQLSVQELRDGSWKTRILNSRQAIVESFRTNPALSDIETLWLSELVSCYYDDTTLYSVRYQPHLGFFEIRYGQSQTDTPLYIVQNCTWIESILGFVIVCAIALLI